MKKAHFTLMILMLALAVGCGGRAKKVEVDDPNKITPTPTPTVVEPQKVTYDCSLEKGEIQAVLLEGGDLALSLGSTESKESSKENPDQAPTGRFGLTPEVVSVVFESKPAELEEIYGTWTLAEIMLKGETKALEEEAMWTALVTGDLEVKNIKLTFTKETVKLTSAMRLKEDSQVRVCEVEAKAKIEEIAAAEGAKGKSYKIQVLEAKKTNLEFDPAAKK